MADLKRWAKWLSVKDTLLKPYYTPGQVALASFLGTPLAGGLIAGRTLSAAGEKRKAWLTYGAAVLITAALFAAGGAMPDRAPRSGLPTAVTVGIYYSSKHLLAPAIVSNVASGAKKGSWWMPIGIGVAFLCAIIAVVFGFFALLPE